MKLALEKWEPDKPLLLRMLAHDPATGAEAVRHLCEPARQGCNVDGTRPSSPPEPAVAPLIATSLWQPAWQ